MAQVRDILDRKGRAVATVTPEKTVYQAAVMMNQERIGALVVVEGDEVTGIFTERDILMRVVAAGRDPKATPVAEVMTTSVISCTPSTPVAECKTLMNERRVSHLPVIESGRLIGIVTSGDTLALEVAEKQDQIADLQSYIFGPAAKG